MSIYRRRIVKILVLALIVGSFSVPLRSASKSKKPYLTLTEVNFTGFNNAYSYVKNLKRSQIKKTTIKISDRNIATAKVSKKTAITIKRKSDAGSCYITVKVALKKRVQKKKSYTFTIRVYVNKNDSHNPATTTPSYTPYTSTPSPSISPSISPSASPSSSPSPQSVETEGRDPNEVAALKCIIKKYDAYEPWYLPKKGEEESDYYEYDTICDFSNYHYYCEWENGHLIFLNLIINNIQNPEEIISFEPFSMLKGLAIHTRYGNYFGGIDISHNSRLNGLILDTSPLKNPLNLRKNNSVENIVLDISAVYENDNNYPISEILLPSSAKRVDCNGPFKSIDFSEDVNLQSLYLHGTKLKTIDLSKNKKLEELEMASPGFKTIDLSKNTNLKKLECSSGIEELNLSNHSLETLYLGVEVDAILYPEFKKLNIAQCINLRELVCCGLSIKQLDLSSNTALRSACFWNCDRNLQVTGLNENCEFYMGWSDWYSE